MSKDAIQAVLRELESLPETDQRRVLDFLGALKRGHLAREAMAGGEGESALELKGNLLVFTGHLDAPDTDWVAQTREERDNELLQAAVGRHRS